MLLEPERHKWVRVSNEDIGEPGCKHWHVRPRWGVLGMLMNWWRVKISSGCPLATGSPASSGILRRMGKRSRKRVAEGSAAEGTTRAERDAARRERARAARPAGAAPRRPTRARGVRPPAEERPPALWHPFPLSELLTLAGIGLMIWGFASGPGRERQREDRRRPRDRVDRRARAGHARAPHRLPLAHHAARRGGGDRSRSSPARSASGSTRSGRC